MTFCVGDEATEINLYIWFELLAHYHALNVYNALGIILSLLFIKLNKDK